MTIIVRQERGGQITIPVEFRRELGIEPDTLFEITLANGELRIKPVAASEPTPASPWLRELYDYLAPAREEILSRGIPEEEVNANIDAAVAAARAKRE
jgi:bifunctional DNA-binding transcriptional regulator/antitoxin component of YhaV-PrlF toxin-antitoxin module